MSRPIKFRAWLKPRWDDDEDAGKMYYNIQDSYDNLGNVEPYDPMTSFASWFDDEVAIVEQYTGLKDKNVKEIYEGDIVESKNGQRYGFVEYLEQNGSFMIWWDSENELIYLGAALHKYEDLEVIGNIHENPELLGGEDA